MKLFLTLLAIFAFFTLFKPFFHAGYPYTHDGENHLARIESYFSALKQGQVPPRWAPTFWGGYGYPVFNYNYPFPNILALPALIVRAPAELTLKLEESLAVMVGAFGVFLFLREGVGEEAALVGVIAYLTAPFLFTDLFVRGAVGEVLAYAVAPHVALGLKRAVRGMTPFRACYLFISMLMLMLAHNIFVLLLLPLAAVYSLSLHWRTLGSRTMMATIWVSFLGVLASMFFWLPALLEKSLVSIDSSSLITESVHHFPTLGELLTSPFQFGFSYTTPVDSLSFNLGWIVVFGVLMAALLVVVRRVRHARVLAALAALIVVPIFLMLPISFPFWQRFPMLMYLQFPWRFLLVTSLLGTYLIALIYSVLRTTGRRLIAVMLFIVVIGMSRKQISTYIHYNDDYYKNYQLTTTVLDEDKPKTLQVDASNLLPQRQVVSTNATTEIHTWNGTHHDYSVHATGDQYITEPTTYFPGWEVHVDGIYTPIEYQHAKGLISFKVAGGDHHIATDFTQHTPARLIGNLTTIFAMILFSWYLWSLKRTSRYASIAKAELAQKQMQIESTHEERSKKRTKKHGR